MAVTVANVTNATSWTQELRDGRNISVVKEPAGLEWSAAQFIGICRKQKPQYAEVSLMVRQLFAKQPVIELIDVAVQVRSFAPI